MRLCSIDDCSGKHEARGLCRRHYLQLPDVKARRNAWWKRYRSTATFRAKVREYQRNYGREYKRSLYATDEAYRERMKARSAARYRTGTGAHVRTALRAVLWAEQGGLCGNRRKDKYGKGCGLPLLDGAHVDHVWPLSKGGPHEAWNLQLLHPACNIAAKDRMGLL